MAGMCQGNRLREEGGGVSWNSAKPMPLRAPPPCAGSQRIPGLSRRFRGWGRGPRTQASMRPSLAGLSGCKGSG